MRLFVAVNPPARAVQELAAAASRLRDLPGADRLRWSESAGWHLTLAFLGDVPADEVPEISRKLAGVAAEHAGFRLRLGGGGTFGDRVLWCGVAGATAALRRLAEDVRDALDVTDDHRFHPHLTLARSRFGDRGMRAMADAMAGFRGVEWEAGEIRLMRSETGFGPARYSVVDGWRLRAQGRGELRDERTPRP
ncbi:RNA 2',3'-cyclic phosphodiesterase [Kitasatospora cheerisanensis]|uniref:RNA 2',3'-cyclic phosphodiesterase n=1 Tax=Kitasatospora cheerisanensis KCTC 2395 TaxID=1348663 RepID=A0A066Z0T6_9ACTN|nr:RNA 2',3'-cyclic phosphodiesterase [Kitasatospora cheerisanensis]KDN83760.1 putative 2'-5' RNA ligase [Kitasatospora cheerisanensis KCTC 2395]